MRRFATILLGLMLGLGLALPAWAQRGPTEPTQVTVSSRKAVPGGTVVVEGTGWAPDTQIDIAWNGTQLAFTTVQADGRFEREVPVPDVEPPRDVQIVVSGTAATGGSQEEFLTLSVVEGTPRGTWLVVGIVSAIVILVLVVGAFLFFRRRRPTLAQQEAEGETPVRNPDPREEPQPEDSRR